MSEEKLIWTGEQQQSIDTALDFNSEENVLIIGKAGTGKSCLIRHIIAELHARQKVGFVCSPTGIAALAINGETIHKVISTIRHSGKIEHLDYILIDEISMARCDLIDELESVLYYAKRNGKVFGGVKLIFSGDPCQLPPVIEKDSAEEEYIKDNYFSEYFFSAHSFAHTKWKIVELTHVFRQKDENYAKMLNNIRAGKNKGTVQYLNLYHTSREMRGVVLTPTNKAATEINNIQLRQIKSPVIKLPALAFGKIQPHEYPAPHPFEFKLGAKVMVIKNIYNEEELELVNGDVGVIDEFEEDTGNILFLSDRTKKIHNIRPMKWEKKESKYDSQTKNLVHEVVASFSQYPLRLAWAITIHKSQGATIEELTIDLRTGMFAAGQLYVALSRGVTLEKLHIVGRVTPEDVITCPVVTQFLQDFKTGVGVKPGSKFEGFLQRREKVQGYLSPGAKLEVEDDGMITIEETFVH